MSKLHSIPNSFSYAFQGVISAFKNEPSFRIQIAIAIISLILGYFLKLEKTEWLILVIVIFTVLILELINTTLEALVDIISPQIHPQAKVAKDVSAAAVLFSSILSVIVGVIIFLPKILLLL